MYGNQSIQKYEYDFEDITVIYSLSEPWIIGKMEHRKSIPRMFTNAKYSTMNARYNAKFNGVAMWS